ncbi:hypothetical protein PHMEG_0005374 [Phytophthora megakarya]|uniref:Uncharacterized protein n=1 Tax=Phytophthora megakarya TaxID=4795 RepID=A0A225WTJ5_9STRA|nr:hypothetical protein PHMEG_0005374 [Phytophthora megakarya]
MLNLQTVLCGYPMVKYDHLHKAWIVETQSQSGHQNHPRGSRYAAVHGGCRRYYINLAIGNMQFFRSRREKGDRSVRRSENNPGSILLKRKFHKFILQKGFNPHALNRTCHENCASHRLFIKTWKPNVHSNYESRCTWRIKSHTRNCRSCLPNGSFRKRIEHIGD